MNLVAAQMTALPSKRGDGNRNPELGTQSTHLLTSVRHQQTDQDFACSKDILDIQIFFVFQGADIE